MPSSRVDYTGSRHDMRAYIRLKYDELQGMFVFLSS